MGFSNGETRRQLTDGLVVRGCPTCQGRGGVGYKERFTCQTCYGTGEIVVRAPDIDPWGGKNDSR